MQTIDRELPLQNYKWRALALLWVAFFLQQGSRQIFSATLPAIQHAFDFTRPQAGLVATVFTFVYGICVPFAGLASDIFRRKWMVVVGVAVFSLGIFGAGFAQGLAILLVGYGIVNAIGQTFYYPASTSLVSQLHSQTRATALGILQLGLYAGIILCSWTSGYFSDLGPDGWKMPFFVFGALGVVWAAVMALGLKDTPAPPPATGAPAKATPLEALRVILSNPVALLIALAFGAHVYVDVGYKTWMPDFLLGAFPTLGLTKASAALNAVLWHYLGAFLGVMVGSRCADKLVIHFPGVRLTICLLGMLVAAPFLFVGALVPGWLGNSSGLAICLAGTGLFGFFRGLFDSNLFASLFDTVPQRYHASATGLILCAGFVVGSVSGTLLGLFSEPRIALASLAPVYALGGVVLFGARRVYLPRLKEKRSC